MLRNFALTAFVAFFLMLTAFAVPITSAPAKAAPDSAAGQSL